MSEAEFSSLARAREAAGMSLEDAARQLKFAPRQLEALEAGELERLPGGTFVRGMLRSYARLLRLDAEPLLAQISARVAPPDAERLAQRYRQPVPFSNGARRSNLVYVALSLTLLGVVAAVALEWRQERAGTPRMAFVSAAQQPAEPPRVAQASAAPAPRVQAPQVPAKQVQAPQVVTAKQLPVPAPARAADEPAAAGQGRIVLQFDGESWVEIHSGTGKLLVAHLHPPGSERVVVGVPPFEVVIGNAQQVRLIYNDKPVDLIPHVKVEVARLTLE